MEQREIKLKAWDKLNSRWIKVQGFKVQNGELLPWEYRQTESGVVEWVYVDNFEIVRYVGLKDKNEKEIYEGHQIRVRKPVRTTQTHYGDNIPNGAYTEPMEPGIETKEYEVSFRDGCFGVEEENGDFIPINWINTQWDEANIRECIAIRNSIWDDPEEGDLQYLLQEYKLKDVNELIEYVSGIEIIGNIHEPISKQLT